MRVRHEGLPRSGLTWTKSEERTLRKIFGVLPVEELATQMGRTVSSIMGKADRMGLINQLQKDGETNVYGGRDLIVKRGKPLPPANLTNYFYGTVNDAPSFDPLTTEHRDTPVNLAPPDKLKQIVELLELPHGSKAYVVLELPTGV